MLWDETDACDRCRIKMYKFNIKGRKGEKLKRV